MSRNKALGEGSASTVADGGKSSSAGMAVKAGVASPRGRSAIPAFRILGIDPGLASTGWGVVEASGGKLRHVDHGCISTAAGLEMGERLDAIASGIEAVIREWKPRSVGMESLYFWRNVTSALPVAEARGAIRLVLARSGVELVDYSPTDIKKAVVGNARAEKQQVQAMVKLLLGLEEPPRPDHAADALAAAICRWHSGGAAFGRVP